MGIHRVGRLVSTGHERVGQGLRVDLDAWGDLVRREQQRRRVGQAREQSSRRSHDHQTWPATRSSLGAKGGQRVQAAGAGRGDFEVRLEAAIGVDLRRWKRQDLLLDHRIRGTLERAKEETDVAHRRLDVGVVGHDVQDDAVAQTARRGRNCQRAYRGRHATDATGGGCQPTLPENGNQQRP